MEQVYDCEIFFKCNRRRPLVLTPAAAFHLKSDPPRPEDTTGFEKHRKT